MPPQYRLRSRIGLALSTALLLAGSLATSAFAQNVELGWSALSAGHGLTSGGTVVARSVVGQSVVGRSQSGGIVVRHGYLNFVPMSEGPPPGASFVVTNTNDSGAGSLRAAIQAANDAPGADAITFNIPGSGVHTITPLTPLPAVTGPVVIDGYTQTGASANTQPMADGSNAVILIELNGVTASGTGLALQGGASTVRGLAINRFATGIALEAVGNNVVEGNFIGTTPAGTAALPNLRGVVVTTSNNRVGGSSPAAANVVSGNLVSGITISGALSTGNAVLGNFIGTTASGTADLTNGAGVYLQAGSNVIGGPDFASRNVILGGANPAVYLEPGHAGANVIQHNYIGTNAAGTQGIGAAGVSIWTANNILKNNVISGNRGVRLQEAPATGNVLTGNFVGLSAAGTETLGNNFGGIVLLRAPANQIGGASAADRNVIAVMDTGIDLGTSDDNVVQGNYLGLNPAGTAAALETASAGSGILISGSHGNLIGGIAAGEGNVIGRYHTGVSITWGATENTVAGNRIGTNAPGTAAVPNATRGIVIVTPQASQPTGGNMIGGTDAGAGNLISGNFGPGIYITGSDDNTIQGNRIGVAADGETPLGNSTNGIEISGSNENLIGGMEAGAGNRIAFNGHESEWANANGIKLSSGTGNAILGNEIFRNRRLGIDLVGGTENDFGVTANDDGDADTGANELQNYPVLTLAEVSELGLSIAGVLSSAPEGSFRIELFSAPAPDTSGHGGGRQFLGFVMVNTDAAGLAGFSTMLPVEVTPGHYVSATATDELNNTSEFSAAVQLQGTIGVDGSIQVVATELRPNYPNPFGTSTAIEFDLAVAGYVDLRVFDTLGRQVAILLSEERPAGRHVVRWETGGLAAGLYLCRLVAHDVKQTRSMAVVR